MPNSSASAGIRKAAEFCPTPEQVNFFKIERQVMRKIFVLVMMLAAFTLALNGCATTSDRETGTETKTGEKAKMSNSDLENAIKAKLDSDAQLKADGLSVDADVDKNTATLSGTVESEAL